MNNYPGIFMEIYQVINGCLVMEDTVASIYSYFVQLFPEEKAFWKDLYEDEKSHTSFLIEAADSGNFDKMQAADLGFSMPLLDRTQKFISNVMSRIKLNPVSLEDALNMALKIEETTVEAFTNELMVCLSPADKNAFLNLLMQEKTHIAKIKNRMIEKGFLKLA
jgi:rubrerythrin